MAIVIDLLKLSVLSRRARILIVLTSIACFPCRLDAQLPACGATDCYVYFMNYTGIYNYDPLQPVSSSNPFLNSIPVPPAGIMGNEGILAVAKNLNISTGTSPTFYTLFLDEMTGVAYYMYYNGSGWVNTGHLAGSGHNIGGGKNYIFDINNSLTSANSGEVSRYDGTGDAVLIATVPPVADIIADDSDNFYILNLNPLYPPAGLYKYDLNGVLVKIWTVNGLPTTLFAGAGLASLGSKLVYWDGAAMKIGTFAGNAINFVQGGVIPQILGDMASCGLSFVPSNRVDTIFHCPGGAPDTLFSSGGPPVTWNVLEGNAIVNGNGSTMTFTADSTSTVTATYFMRCDTTRFIDTFRIMVPQAAVSISGPDTIPGCGVFIDSLKADIWDTTSGLIYQYSWSPASGISSGNTTSHPVISPVTNTTYVLSVSTSADQGSCIWNDTISVAVRDLSAHPDFGYVIHYGCEVDTVFFTNLSTDADRYHWSFGDNKGDTSVHPVHAYITQGIYSVKLEAVNESCQDTIVKSIDTQHPLRASFSVDDDTICQGGWIDLTNTSIYTEISGPAHFLWTYGDGSQDTMLNASHMFDSPGAFDVILTIVDFVPCLDTAHHIVIVDSLPSLNYAITDSIICEGKNVVFMANYTHDGFMNLVWDFGAGDLISDLNPVTHAYDTSGSFPIAVTGHYRSCPDTVFSKIIKVVPFPVIDLGPDTSMCPNGPAILIGDFLNSQRPEGRWSWNTGDTSAFIQVRHPGIYTAKVTIDGCAEDDSVEVFKDCYIDIPDAFTPNGDGVNDYFLPRQLLSKGLNGYHMQIFNRWGQLIFETSKIDGRGWDGKFNGVPQPDGVFVYLIETIFKNGVHEKYQGNVTLMK